MYVCYSKKFTFTHVPKTAGVSIIRHLRKAVDIEMQLKEHEDFEWVYDNFLKTSKLWKNFYNFAFVRNPWDRIYSSFCYLNEGGMNFVDNRIYNLYIQPYLGDFNEFISNHKHWYKKHVHFIHMCKQKCPHFLPQHEFVSIPCKNSRMLKLDFIGRFENLREDMLYISDKFELALDPNELPKLNVSQREVDYRDAYDNKSIDIVANLYSTDIDIFNYTF